MKWLISLLFAFSLHAAQLEVKKSGVKLFKQASKKSEVVSTLKKGDILDSKSRKGMYWSVTSLKGKEGFVSFTKVKRKSGGSDKLGQAIQNAAKTSRDMDGVKTARARSAVMGVRGLDESAETASAGNVKPNIRLVYSMEDMIVTDKEIDDLENMIQKEIENKMKKSRF